MNRSTSTRHVRRTQAKLRMLLWVSLGVCLWGCGDPGEVSGPDPVLTDAIDTQDDDVETRVIIEIIEDLEEPEGETGEDILPPKPEDYCIECMCDETTRYPVCGDNPSCRLGCAVMGPNDFCPECPLVECYCLCADGWRLDPNRAELCLYERCEAVCADHLMCLASSSVYISNQQAQAWLSLGPATLAASAASQATNGALHFSGALIPVAMVEPEVKP